MTTTTIKVSRETRDLLKVQAEAAHQSLGEYLHALAAAADRRTRFSQLREAIRNTPAEQLDSQAAETTSWEATELSDASK